MDYELKEPQLIFNGIVDNNSIDNYVDYDTYEQIMKRLGLTINQLKIVDNLNDMDNVRFALKKVCG